MAVEIDIIEGNSVVEANGIIEEYTRVANVTGMSHSSSNALFNALQQSSMPVPGDAHPDDSTLILGPRSARPLAGGGPGSAQVILTYRSTAVFYRGGSSLSQIQTSNDKAGTKITVTYAAPQNGERQDQCGVINPFNTEASLVADVLIQNAAPGAIALDYTNRLNLGAWQGRSEGEWLCTRVSFEPWAASADWWRYYFEFQLRPLLPPFDNAWQPEVQWIAADGIIPDDLVDGTGRKVVEWHEYMDFETQFPS